MQVIFDPNIFSDHRLGNMQEHFFSIWNRAKGSSTFPLTELKGIPYTRSLHIGRRSPKPQVHEWFHLQALEDPNLVALDCAELGFSMTYGELELSSNRIANCELAVPPKKH